jgi:AraC-like DNA-binding protein
MVGSSVVKFTDPQPYQAAIRPAQVEILVTAKGDFHAELTRIELPRLLMQRGRESLPRIVRSTVSSERPPIFFLADVDQAAMRHSGMKLSFGDIMAVGSGSPHHHRTWAPCHWATMSLTREDLAATGYALVGRDLTVPPFSYVVRPASVSMSRLLQLHDAAGQLAKIAPEVLAKPEVVRALEQALVHAMIMGLTDGTPVEMNRWDHRHSTIIARFEELLAASQGCPLYLAEICTAIGVSERTLRVCCHDHFGMGPIRYLWLRRMHLARHALMRADSTTSTVTEIATEFGFWELGRFSVAYRALFGETPSASLRRPPEDLPTSQNPLAFADSEYA